LSAKRTGASLILRDIRDGFQGKNYGGFILKKINLNEDRISSQRQGPLGHEP
jgi:hypothetical protein